MGHMSNNAMHHSMEDEMLSMIEQFKKGTLIVQGGSASGGGSGSGGSGSGGTGEAKGGAETKNVEMSEV